MGGIFVCSTYTMKKTAQEPTQGPSREAALELLYRYTKSESLRRHALAVEAVMRHFAHLLNAEGDVERWGTIGLVHDLDYEQYPQQHCQKAKQILTEEGWPEDWIRAILSHGWNICTDVEPRTRLEQTLYTIDELTGLIAATALMRPSRSLHDMTAKSVKKKWSQKSFAAGVNREIIVQGATMLGMELSAVITETIAGMRTVAEQLGLQGNPADSA